MTGTPRDREATHEAQSTDARPWTVHHGNDSYPRLLRATADPPQRLYVKGQLTGGPCVAMVGSRACSAYGRSVATRLAGQLARVGITVVSGLARGIDAAAHRGCLDAGGATIAVLPGGLYPVYPRQHRALARQVAAGGALVAEHEPGTEVARWHFPKRNRIIAGLSWATIVVEAAARSGARITANLALEYGREVLVVPGPITSETSAGCHALLADGARPCTGVADILDHLPAAVTATLQLSIPTATAPDIDAPSRAMLELLRQRGTLGAAQAAELLGWSLVPTLATVTGLELQGLVRILPGNRIEAC